jgi:uncharacterized membrane protein HdeD (DUF308 family)
VTDPIRSRYWLVPTVRSIVALATALVITFAPGQYSPELGYLTFGAFCLISGASTIILGIISMARGRTLWLVVVGGAILAIAGLISLISFRQTLPLLLLLVSSVFAVTGIVELVIGLTNRRIGPSRDWIFAGALGALFGFLVLLIPADYSLQFTGPDHVERTLTASVILVGSFGAYAAILGIYLLIAGLSLKWSRQTAAEGT